MPGRANLNFTYKKGYRGSDEAIAVTYVDEIPLLCSGKGKKLLNRPGIKIENPNRAKGVPGKKFMDPTF